MTMPITGCNGIKNTGHGTSLVTVDLNTGDTTEIGAQDSRIMALQVYQMYVGQIVQRRVLSRAELLYMVSMRIKNW